MFLIAKPLLQSPQNRLRYAIWETVKEPLFLACIRGWDSLTFGNRYRMRCLRGAHKGKIPISSLWNKGLKQRWPCILTVSSQSSVACSKASQSEPFWLEYLPLLSGDTANSCELFHELASYFIGKSSCCSLRHSQKMAEPLAACILKWLCRGDNVLVLQQTCYVTAQRPVGIWRVISFSWNKASLC